MQEQNTPLRAPSPFPQANEGVSMVLAEQLLCRLKLLYINQGAHSIVSQKFGFLSSKGPFKLQQEPGHSAPGMNNSGNKAETRTDVYFEPVSSKTLSPRGSQLLRENKME
ncbi:uncharacterized protein LOC144617231 [Panthera onca]